MLAVALGGCRGKEPAAPTPAAAPRIVIESARKAVAEATKHTPTGQDLRLIAGATAEEVGIAFYPGATVASSELVKNNNSLTAGAKLTTRDPYQQVLDFYRARYKSPELKEKQSEGPEGKTTWLNWRDPQGNFTIAVWRDDAHKQTVITLARIKSNKRPVRSSP